ncbi:MAG: uroporphyrinogen decarboxylase family protein [Armatimonadota bacterium]
MTRRERIMALLHNQPVDMTPVTTYGVDRYGAPWRQEHPSYAEVLEYADRYDHIFAHASSYYASFGNTPVLRLEDPEMVEEERSRVEDDIVRELTIHAPRGDLDSRCTETAATHTVWVTDYPITDDDDIETFIKVPFVPEPVSEEMLNTLRHDLGDRGVVEIQVPTALCLACENMRYEDFMLRTMTCPDLLYALLDRMQELVEQWVRETAENGGGPVYRLFGAEYAVPPMLPPEMFEKTVVAYDAPLIDLIHDLGGYARYHCHGPVGHIVQQVVDMGADMFEPCEGPPNGDIELAELAEIVNDRMVIMGNIQAHDMETASPEEIDRLVKETLAEVGDTCRHILQPTASPFEVPLGERVAENFKQLLESGWKYG